MVSHQNEAMFTLIRFNKERERETNLSLECDKYGKKSRIICYLHLREEKTISLLHLDELNKLI